MVKRAIALIYSVLMAVAACSAAVISGVVVDEATGEPIEFATVSIQPGNDATMTDERGMFRLVSHSASVTLQVSFVGYSGYRQQLFLTGDKQLTVKMKNNSKRLDEVVVTAQESRGITSSSRIDRDAMSHLQPSSFTDLMELLPGNISKNPDMGSANTITLRETGTLGANGTKTDNPAYAISSLGTLFLMDGAPINGDANLQGVPSADTSSPEYKRDITGRGVDMRTISTDNIESVEVVRGIPSAEYGNLTSGLVNIKRIRKATPFTARFKADEFSKLFAVGKGFNLGKTDHIMNVDAGYLDSKIDPRNNLENYKRLNVSARFNLSFTSSPRVDVLWVTGLDYTGSFDNSKEDPDLNYNKINEYKSSYNRFGLTSNLTLTFKRLSWLRTLNINTSASLQNDVLERRKQVAPQRASVAPTTMEPGVHDGQYLLGEYVADYKNEGRPVNVFVKLKAQGNFGIAGFTNDYKLGGEWTLSKNLGNGQVYDLTRPLSASWTTRPRAFKEIPALKVLSFFVEDNISHHFGRHALDFQAGLRTIQLLGLESDRLLSGKVYLDPRLNLKWTFPELTVGGHNFSYYVAAGYGLTTKMPTVSHLYPQPHYTDFIQLNYYDVARPTELSRISLRTYIDDVTNRQLAAARNRKWEVRVGANLGANHISITYFNEHLSSGFRSSSYYRPYEYTRYDASAIDPLTLTAPPALETLPSETVSVLNGYSIYTNGSRLDKEGVELVIGTARLRPLATALTITGAWFRSTYVNSQMLFDPVSDVVGDTPVRNRYIGYYDCYDGRENQQFNTNFMFDTQITRWGLVFSTTVQCMWFTSTRKLWQNGVPTQYLDVADGQLHPYTAADQSDEILQFLVKHYNDDSFKKQTIPTALFINLKATKQIGKYLKIAVFANKLIDYQPDYKSNGLTIRRSSDPYFGMELNLTL